MPAQHQLAYVCPQFVSTWRVPSSTTDEVYEVDMDGPGHRPSCACPAFRYFRGEEYDRTCKHIRLVREHGCFEHPQYERGPNDYADLDIVLVATGENGENGEGGGPCGGCGSFTIPVVISV